MKQRTKILFYNSKPITSIKVTDSLYRANITKDVYSDKYENKLEYNEIENLPASGKELYIPYKNFISKVKPFEKKK